MRNTHVIAAIRDRMADIGLKQADLARAVGLSQQGLSAKLCGRVNISVDDLLDMSIALRCLPCELLKPPARRPQTRHCDRHHRAR